MSLTVNDQLGYLVMYSVASLFLLIRFHALEEQAEWLRRRIGDPAAISGIYLRGGSVFIVLGRRRFAPADPDRARRTRWRGPGMASATASSTCRGRSPSSCPAGRTRGTSGRVR